jgi:hypothetical protein
MANERVRLGVPALEGWETLTEASVALGITRWAAHKMADNTDPDHPPEFTTARYIGDPARPVYVVRIEERKRIARERDRQAAAKKTADQAATG